MPWNEVSEYEIWLKWYSLYIAEPMQTFQVGTDKLKTFVVSGSVPKVFVLEPQKFIGYTDDIP